MSKTKRERRWCTDIFFSIYSNICTISSQEQSCPYDPSFMRLPFQGKRRYIFESERSPLIYLSMQFFLKLSMKNTLRSILTLIFDVSFVLRIILQYIFSDHPFKILIIKTFTSIKIKEINSKILIREDPFKRNWQYYFKK